MTRIRHFLKAQWGLSICYLLIVIGLINLMRQQVHGHYLIFTNAANFLWNQLSPHNNDFGTNVGQWFYSPSCGMFFFKFFALFPENIGLTLYTLFSVLVFFWGARLFIRTAMGSAFLESGLKINLFWTVVASQIYAAILASKVELFMTGIVFAAGAWLIEKKIENRKTLLAAFLFSMILNWKFQPLPTLGLLTLALLLWWRNVSFVFWSAVGCIFWTALPLLFVSYDYLAQVYHDWTKAIADFMPGAFLNYDNIFPFLEKTILPGMAYNTAQTISLMVGAAFAYLIFLSYKNRKSFEDTLLLALALGATFTFSMSPASQSNAYILASPLILLSVLAYEPNAQTKTGRLYGAACFTFFIVLIFAYSDLVPKDLKLTLRSWSLKPIVCFLFAIYLAKRVVSSDSRLISR